MRRNKRRLRRSRGTSNKLASLNMSENSWKARLVSTNDFEFCTPSVNMEISRDDFVIISTRYGIDLARITGSTSNLDSVGTANIRQIIRIATEKDFSKRKSLEKLEKEAFETCREKISKMKLAMKLVSSHYTLDERRLLFFFVAESRVDCRALLRLLMTHFKKRIELRHIGARDETRVIGGVAVCGRLYCCHSITDQLAAVSIKMAKDQNLPINLVKASGQCNRLFCCLSYELEHYASVRQQLPLKRHQDCS